MFHLKILNINTDLDLAAIQATVAAHPERHFTIQLSDYSFLDTKIKKLLKSKCGICISKKSDYSKGLIKGFITIGEESVVLIAKDFPEADLKIYLQKGASVIVELCDEFDVHQINNLVIKGQEKVFVIGTRLQEDHIKNILNLGGSVLLKRKDLGVRKINKLLPLGKERIYIQSGKISNIYINKFLEGNANVIFGKGNQITTDRIKEKVEKYTTQIRIESDHKTFKSAWINEMETLGAIII